MDKLVSIEFFVLLHKTQSEFTGILKNSLNLLNFLRDEWALNWGPLHLSLMISLFD